MRHILKDWPYVIRFLILLTTLFFFSFHNGSSWKLELTTVLLKQLLKNLSLKFYKNTVLSNNIYIFLNLLFFNIGRCYRFNQAASSTLTIPYTWLITSLLDDILFTYLSVGAEHMTLHFIHGIHSIRHGAKMKTPEHHLILCESPCQNETFKLSRAKWNDC